MAPQHPVTIDSDDIDEDELELDRIIDLQDDPEYLAEKNTGVCDVR